MIFLEVKHDTKHKKWHRLSVRIMEECPYAAIETTAMQHLYQYAADHQMNYHQVAIRAVSEKNGLIYNRVSNATANKG